MADVIKFRTYPGNFIANADHWSTLDHRQKRDLLAEGAEAEIDRALKLFAQNKRSAEQTKEFILGCAQMIIRD